MKTLKAWFNRSKRDLPWREKPTPYGVWVSEVMLQQTGVSVVVPYYLYWMERFPSISALAKAPIDDVIKAWEGLGYYSRARNLHAGAIYVTEHHNGELPSTEEELSKIKGLGPYTVGAILSFAFHKKATAVDGNVLRVLTRFFCIKEDISKFKTVQLIREKAEELLTDDEPWVINEALIELGATICQKKAKCKECPLKSSCQAKNLGLVDQIPYKSAKIKYEKISRTVAIITNNDFFLVRKGKSGEIMQDLHEFPYVEGILEKSDLHSFLKESLQLEVSVEGSFKQVSHSYTRYRVRLHPLLCRTSHPKEVTGYKWIPLKELKKLPFSSGHRRLLSQLVCNR